MNCRGAYRAGDSSYRSPRSGGGRPRAGRWKGRRPHGWPHRRAPPPPSFAWSPLPRTSCGGGKENRSRGASSRPSLANHDEKRLAPRQTREAKRRKAHCPTNRRLRGGASMTGRARLSALHRGTHHRLLPRWLSPRTGFPDVSSSQVFCPLASSRRLSTLRADRSFCRSTGAPEPPECGLAIPPAGTAPRSAFQACLPEGDYMRLDWFGGSMESPSGGISLRGRILPWVVQEGRPERGRQWCRTSPDLPESRHALTGCVRFSDQFWASPPCPLNGWHLTKLLTCSPSSTRQTTSTNCGVS
jgi:hypothetical protein